MLGVLSEPPGQGPWQKGEGWLIDRGYTSMSKMSVHMKTIRLGDMWPGRPLPGGGI